MSLSLKERLAQATIRSRLVSGTHRSKVILAEPIRSRKSYDGYRIKFEIIDGAAKGAVIGEDYWFTEAAIEGHGDKLKQLTALFEDGELTEERMSKALTISGEFNIDIQVGDNHQLQVVSVLRVA